MLVLVTYDVKTASPEGDKRLRRVAKICKDYGQRVQYSVFECVVDPAQWTYFRQRLVDAIVESEDSLRWVRLFWNEAEQRGNNDLVR